MRATLKERIILADQGWDKRKTPLVAIIVMFRRMARAKAPR